MPAWVTSGRPDGGPMADPDDELGTDLLSDVDNPGRGITAADELADWRSGRWKDHAEL